MNSLMIQMVKLTLILLSKSFIERWIFNGLKIYFSSKIKVKVKMWISPHFFTFNKFNLINLMKKAPKEPRTKFFIFDEIWWKIFIFINTYFIFIFFIFKLTHYRTKIYFVHKASSSIESPTICFSKSSLYFFISS